MAEQHTQEQARAAHESAPSAVKTVDHMAQVMVDQWGHTGEFTRGDFVSRSDAKKRGFDFDWAVNMGTLRLLTEAETRSLPHTKGIDALGKPDEDFARTMRFHAGMPEELPKTVTPKESYPEPEEWTKPSTPIVKGPPAARPVEIVGSAQEAMHAGDFLTETTRTESGQPAFETSDETKAEEEHSRRGRRG